MMRSVNGDGRRQLGRGSFNGSSKRNPFAVLFVYRKLPTIIDDQRIGADRSDGWKPVGQISMPTRKAKDFEYMIRSVPCETDGDSSVASSPAAAPAPQVLALVQGIRQLRAVLGGLTDIQYAQKPVGHFNSSVGGHVRHSLDHIRSLLAAMEGDLLDYDARERDTAIETSRVAALAELDAFESELERVSASALARPLTLRAMLTSDGLSIDAQTSVAREFAFVLSHTIHHNALVAAMLHHLGVTPPADFGFAPSTVAYLNDRACAPLPASH